MLFPTQQQLAQALDDVRGAISLWPLWHMLAWNDIKQRYRRSTLGPIWITISLAIQMLVMSVLFASLFNTSFAEMLPYVAAGLVFWGLIQGSVNEGASTFVSATNYLTQVRRPLTMYIFQTLWRNMIVLAHNFIIFIIVAAIYRVSPNPWSIWLWPLGMLLSVLCLGWIAVIAAVISARFRDFPMLIQNLFTALFWITPVMYFQNQLGARGQQYLNFNPLTHVMALMRSPLIGEMPTLTNWLVVLATTVIGWTVAILFFARYRARIVFWL